MVVVRLIEVALVAFGGAFLWTQVVSPMWAGRPTFPWFRARRLKRQIARVEEQLEALDLQRELEDKRDQAQVKVEEQWRRAMRPLPHEEDARQEEDR